jgi:sugar phosphate isomerase/epimerase
MIRGFACCNEMYEPQPVVEGFRALRAVGYDAVEVAPYTFGDPVFPQALRMAPEVRAAARDMGLHVLGLHWLFARTDGLHVHHPDAAVRRATREHVVRLMDLCRALGGAIMVFGSPPARALLPEESWEAAFRRTRDFFLDVMPEAAARGVSICFEPLARRTTTFIHTAAEALALMREVNHPNFLINLDTGALTDEAHPPAETIRQLGAAAPGAIRHVQVNDPNRLGPGMGDLDLRPIRDALEEVGYDGYLSVEAFDFTPGADRIARESLRYLRAVWGPPGTPGTPPSPRQGAAPVV